jgi:hypothetical protein
VLIVWRKLRISAGVKLSVMDATLTLKLNQETIESGKKYAANKKLSLSRIVEVYLQSLTAERELDEIQISPFVRSMSTGKSVPADIDLGKRIFR